MEVNRSNIDKIYAIIMAFFLPIVGLLFSFRYSNKKWFKYILIIICFCFGFTMYIDDPVYDASRYRDYFLDITIVNINYLPFLFENINNAFIQDYYEVSMAYFISRFTNNPQYYFAALGLIFGIIYANNAFLFSKMVPKKSFFAFSFFLAFLLYFGPWAINGARFGTATQFFIFILFSVLLFQKKKYIYLLIVLPFIHFAFLIPILIFLTFYLFRKRIKNNTYIFLVLFILSRLITFFDFNFIDKIIVFLPDFIAFKVETYTDSSYVRENQSEVLNASFLARLTFFCEKIYIILFYVAMYLFYTKFKNNNKFYLNDYVLFLLFYTSLISIVSIVPSFERFVHIYEVLSFIIAVNIFFNRKKCKSANLILMFSIPFLLIVLLRNIRYGLLFLGDDFILTSPITILLKTLDLI